MVPARKATAPGWRTSNSSTGLPGLPAEGCLSSQSRYILGMSRLTRQEQLVLCIVLGLLLTGWAVKAYRTAHPPAATIQNEGVPASSGQAKN
jgi:hypothetical protein